MSDEPKMAELFDLTGRVALVTGGAGWLGRAMSNGLAEAGAQVAIASRNLEACEKAASEIGRGAKAYHLDCADPQSIEQLFQAIDSDCGPVKVLVNNSYGGPVPRIPEATPDDFTRSLNVGVTAYFLAAREAHRRMKANGGGSIINIASMYGMVSSYPHVYEGLPFSSPPNYHAVKGAVIHLTRHLAAYFAADGVRVNAISPGPFPRSDTQQDEEFMRRLSSKVPLGRIGQRHEVKGAAVFLASDASSYITGHNLVVDGGWTVW